MSIERLSLSQLNAMDRSAFVSQIGWVYEHSPWVAERAWEDRPFSTMDDLYAAMERAVHSAMPQQQLALIQAHPDLAGRPQLSERTNAGFTQRTDWGGFAPVDDRRDKSYWRTTTRFTVKSLGFHLSSACG